MDLAARVHDIRSAQIHLTLLNFREGGRQPGGGFDLEPCVETVAAAPEFCDLVVICEANHYAHGGAKGKHALANALAAATGRPMVGELGSLDRGEFGPAVFYDPTVIRLDEMYAYGLPLHANDKRNWLRGHHARSGHEFGLLPLHWHHLAQYRPAEAQLVTFTAALPYPVFLIGDTNTSADGSKTTWADGRPKARTDYRRMPPHKRFHKGLIVPGVAVEDTVDDTSPLDLLLGWWDATCGTRVGGSGLVDLAEVAAYTHGEHHALTPTVHPYADGTAPRIDLVMANGAGARCLIPGTFSVGPLQYPRDVLDHTAIRVGLDLQATENGP